MTIEALNNLNVAELEEKFEQCCAASKWHQAMATHAPYANENTLQAIADDCWRACEEADFLEAFLGHPKIGNVESLAKKFQATKKWAGNEQELVNEASMDVIEALAKGNEDYEKRFGFIFIVFATGKTAQQMLDLLLERLPNERAEELLIAAGEQHKITKLRIQKLIA